MSWSGHPRSHHVGQGDLAGALVRALRGHRAPRINSDRRVHPDAPVYYRYGPFRSRYQVGANGTFDLVMRGPAGEAYPGAAGSVYQLPPPWAPDPFETASWQPATPAGTSPSRLSRVGAAHTGGGVWRTPSVDPTDVRGRPIVLGGRYRLCSGLTRSARGDVFRAVDRVTGQRVILKEARAWIEERDDGGDIRMNLRHEIRVLRALADLSGVPRVLDHFAIGDDEYVVLTELGTTDLRLDVVDHGLYLPDPHADRSLLDLGGSLARLLRGLHERGVIMRDLSPKKPGTARPLPRADGLRVLPGPPSPGTS